MIIVVRGQRNGVDPYFQCASHQETVNSYVVLEVDSSGHVTTRTVFPASRRGHIERFCKTQDDRIVYIDRRRDAQLLPEPHVDGSRCAASILSTIRRQKTEQEREELIGLDRNVQALLRSSSPDAFRNSAATSGDPSFAYERRTPHFLQRHYGLKRRGLCADVADVVNPDAAWKLRVAHARKCLDALESKLVVGACVEEVEKDFVQRMRDGGCRVRSRPVGHIGYEASEPVPDGPVGAYDVLRLTAAFDDGKDNGTLAVLRRACHPSGTYRGVAEAETTRSAAVGIDKDSFSSLSAHCETAETFSEARRIALFLLKANMTSK